MFDPFGANDDSWLDECECRECGRVLTREEAESDSDICPECIQAEIEDYRYSLLARDDYEDNAPDSWDAQFGHYYD